MLKLKNKNVDVVNGDVNEFYYFIDESKNEYILCKTTIGAIDEDGAECVGIGGVVSLMANKNMGKIKKLLKNKCEIIKPYANMIETEIYTSPDELDDVFNYYKRALEVVC